MRVCRTLDYIVNTDLHLYLFVKFENARSEGLQIEIELTEPITRLPIDSKEYLEIVDLILDYAFRSIVESTDKKLKFYMFYTDKELHLVIQYAFYKNHSNRAEDMLLPNYKNINLYTTEEGDSIIRYLVVTC